MSDARLPRIDQEDLCPADVVRGGEDDACAHPVAGWRWYPGGEFEPMLYAACKRHCTCDGLLIAQALGLAGNDE